MVLTTSPLKEVGKVLAVAKELIGLEDSEQLVSVTVVLSVTVTMDIGNGFSGVEVELAKEEV